MLCHPFSKDGSSQIQSNKVVSTTLVIQMAISEGEGGYPLKPKHPALRVRSIKDNQARTLRVIQLRMPLPNLESS